VTRPLDQPLPNGERRLAHACGGTFGRARLPWACSSPRPSSPPTPGGGGRFDLPTARRALPVWPAVGWWLAFAFAAAGLACGLPVRSAELSLGAPRSVNQGHELRLLVLHPDTNKVYEIQSAARLEGTSVWRTAQFGFRGQTNFVVSLPPGSNAFFRLRLPALAVPPQLTVAEDLSLPLGAIQIQFPPGPGPELTLTASHGSLRAQATAGLSLEGNGTSRLVLRGPLPPLGDVAYCGDTNFFGHDRLWIGLTNRAAQPPVAEAAQVELLITPVNDLPETRADSFACVENTTLIVPAPGVLANDTDADGDALAAEWLSGPDHGELTLNPDGSFFYLPAPLFHGQDSFTYRARDAAGPSEAARVTLDVRPGNHAPQLTIVSPAQASSWAVGRPIPLQTQVAENDGEVGRVEYREGATLLATAEPPDFRAQWEHAPMGLHTIQARAVLDGGAVTFSASVSFVVDADCDGDGVSDTAEAIRGTDPCDFFDGQAPRLEIVAGDFQSGHPRELLARALTVRVSKLDGTPWVGQLAAYTAEVGGGLLSLDGVGDGTARLDATTDGAGRAAVRLKLPEASGQLVLVRVRVTNALQSAETTFVATALGPHDEWIYGNVPVAVAAGAEHSLALLTDGTVRSWGRNEAGQLGPGLDPAALPLSAVPMPVPGLSNVTAIAAGAWHSLALQADGTVVSWGEFHEHYQAATPPDVSGAIGIAAGAGHSLALLGNGTVRAWGDPFTRFAPPAGLFGVSAVAAGPGFSLGLLGDGRVVAWGLGPLELDHGQTRVPPTLSAVSAIAAGGAHALALVAGGRVIGWGANDFGQAASPSDLDHVVAIAAGATTSLALRDDGTIRRWGNSLAGDVVLPAGIRAIGASAASSGGHVEVLGTDGAVWGWGDNAYGQLGNGTRLASTEPVRASGLPPNDTVTNPVPFVVYTPLR
jgi:hypothetical protein